VLAAWPQPQALAEPPDAAEAERRKQLIRLGNGTVKLPDPVGKVYPLESMLERCMEVNPQLVARQHKELFARERASEANWGSFPTFEVTSTFTIVPAQTNPNEVSSNIEKYLSLDVGPFSATSIRMVVPIFTFGKLDAAQELAQLGIDQEELETQKMRLKLLTQTRQAYYSLQLGKQIQGLIGDSVGVMRQEIERLEEAREFGDAKVDVVQLRKLQIYETEISARILDNERLVNLTREALAVLVQLEVDAFDVVPFDEEVDTSLLLSAEDYLAVARQNRPDIELLQKALAAREQQVNLERARFWPDLFFAADFSLGYSTEEARDQQGFVTDLDGNDLPVRVAPFSNPYNYTLWLPGRRAAQVFARPPVLQAQAGRGPAGRDPGAAPRRPGGHRAEDQEEVGRGRRRAPPRRDLPAPPQGRRALAHPDRHRLRVWRRRV
jgi:hypothetical protein